MTFDNIPSGFQGFLFSDPILEINIYNQIGVPSTINMELKGLDEYGNELESIVIDQSINSPDFAGSSLGLIDTTCIRIHSECIDKYSSVCGDYTCEECEENDDCESSAQSTTLSEFLQEAPNTLEVSGISTLDGNGYIYPDRYVWGDFNLEVPFSLIMGDTMIVGNMDTIFNDLNIIPAQPSVLQPMDPSTQESIDSSFVGAFISSDIVNHTPITGNFSLLISNNQDFFPTTIDELVTNCFDEFCTYTDSESIKSIIELLDSESNCEDEDDVHMIGNFNVCEIDEIKYIPMNSSDLRVKKMEFYSPSDILWIGRIVDFELPDIPIDANGNIIESEVNSETVISSIDEVQIDMINDSNQNQLRYINSFIRINNSYDMNGDGYLDVNDDGIVNLHSSDFIKITSVVTFTINFGDF